MTRFEELYDIINRNKNKKRKGKLPEDSTASFEDELELEVSGTESSRNSIVT